MPSAPPPRSAAAVLGEPVRPEHYSLAPPLPEDDPDPTERTERRSFSALLMGSGAPEPHAGGSVEEVEVLIGDEALLMGSGAPEPHAGDEDGDDESSWLRELAELAARRSRRGQDGSVTNEWAITGQRAPISGPPPSDEDDDQAETQPLSGTHRLRRARLVC